MRLRSVGRTEKPPVLEHELEDEDASAAMIGEWRMVFDGRARESQLADRAKLRPGNAFKGPALVVEYSTTTVVPPDFRCRVDKGENLILEPVSL
ncbi:MAG: hypothetical protein IH878_13710 [Gemmatimonadetes bacterium]|nr:hypothetical protein [Gemmatimonadota bacterium]